jgi:hypothetical protein
MDPETIHAITLTAGALLFAALGVGCWWQSRRERQNTPAPPTEGDADQAQTTDTKRTPTAPASSANRG